MQPVSSGASRRAGSIPLPSTFATADYWGWDKEQRNQWRWAALMAIANPEGKQGSEILLDMVGPMDSCELGAQRRHSAMAWIYPAGKSAHASEWRQAHEQLLARLAKLDRELDAAAASASTPPDSPRVAELLRRAARDRVIHSALEDPAWTAGLSDAAGDSWNGVIRTRLLATVCDNSAWLKSQVAGHGWFEKQKFGEEADAAAWRLLHHSNRDGDFQRETFTLLQGLPKEATSRKQLAYLTDKLAGFADSPMQRFGTRRLCKHDGSSAMWPELDDPDHVNERRTAVGLEPIDPAPLAKDPSCRRPR